MGTSVVALLAVIIGEFTMSVAFLFNRGTIEEVSGEMVRMNNLSVTALKSGDKTGYTSCNRLANDMFGRQFFLMIALSASSLWPAFFALAWMQTRFADVEFHLPFSVPVFGQSVSYVFTFIVCYVVMRLFFSRIKRYLPYFKKMKKITDSYSSNTGRLMPFPGFHSISGEGKGGKSG